MKDRQQDMPLRSVCICEIFGNVLETYETMQIGGVADSRLPRRDAVSMVHWFPTYDNTQLQNHRFQNRRTSALRQKNK